jgi:hypothetical protein
MIKYSTLKLRLNLTFLVGALLFVSCSGEEEKAVVVYVNDPVPASFVDLPAGGRASNTFTVTTNSTVAGPISSTTTDSYVIHKKLQFLCSIMKNPLILKN